MLSHLVGRITHRYKQSTCNPVAGASLGTNAPRARAVLSPHDNLIYFGGGRSAGGTNLTEFRSYDPVTNTYTSRANMPSAAGGNGGLGAIGDKVYRVATDSGSVFEYDIASNTWTTRLSTLGTSGGWARYAGALGAFFHIIDENANANSQKHRRYDPATNTITDRALHGNETSFCAGVDFANQFFYLMGGFSNATSTYVNTNRRYDPTSNAWTTRAVMPSPIKVGTPVMPLGNGSLAIPGGQTSSTSTSASVDIYSPESNTWLAGNALLSSTGQDSFNACDANGDGCVWTGDGVNSLTRYQVMDALLRETLHILQAGGF